MVEKKVIYSLPAPLEHAIPIHHYNMSFLKLSKVKIFPNTVVYTKNTSLEGLLILQMLFQENDKPTGLQSNDRKI
jgi:hypothetical protein